MSFELPSVAGPEKKKIDSETAVNAAMGLIQRRNGETNPFVWETFSDPRLFAALSEDVQASPEALADLIEQNNEFANLLGQARRKPAEAAGLFREEVALPESAHADGRVRRAESGPRINLEYLESQGIDPSKIMLFRITQPADVPKPELYWTSDFFETVRGLQQEIPAELRSTAVILAADLATLDEGGGLIQDVNDDNGLAVRRISPDPFDQKQCMAKINPKPDKQA